MSVSSAPREYRISDDQIHRGDYEQIKKVWDKSDHALSNSRAPSCLIGAGEDRKIRLFKIFDEVNELVAYFPFEEKHFCGIRIIQPAFYELTLEFIDLSVIPEWRELAPEIFLDWVRAQKNTATFLFMCNENSLIASRALHSTDFLVEERGKYYFCDLPKSLEEFIEGVGRRPRREIRQALKAFDDTMNFEVVEGNVFGDKLQVIIDEFIRLHKCVFPGESAMLPHKDELIKYIENGMREGVVFFTCAREISTGELVAVDLFSRSHRYAGLIQVGRRVDQEYHKIGMWLLTRSIAWAIDNGVKRFEFQIGDQEYKKNLSTGVHDAVSVTHFSSKRARYIARIRQRLGRRFASLR